MMAFCYHSGAFCKDNLMLNYWVVCDLESSLYAANPLTVNKYFWRG